MSQYPPNPSYNPYEQRPNDPNAGSGTSYGGNTPSGPPYNPYPGNPPSGPQNPYNPYPGNPPSGPGSNPGQYGAYPPTPAPPPPTAPNTDYNPYDPYSPTYVNTNPNAAYGAYQQPAYQAPPPAFQTAPAPSQQPAPKRRGPRTMLIVLVVIGLVVIAGGILGALIYNNGQKSNANATATAGANATSVAQANASATANAALTATAVASTYPFSANKVLDDPLSDNSKGFGWQTGSGCAFTGSAYHVTDSQSNTFNDCVGTNTNYSNFTFQAEMVVSKGDGGGLVFRGNVNSGKIYRLTFYTDSTYGLYIYVDNTGTNARILKDGSYGTNVDLTVTHTVSIVARGSSLTIYFDKQMIDTVTDSTFSSGQIGFNAYDITNAVDAVFTNAVVYQLP